MKEAKGKLKVNFAEGSITANRENDRDNAEVSDLNSNIRKMIQGELAKYIGKLISENKRNQRSITTKLIWYKTHHIAISSLMVITLLGY